MDEQILKLIEDARAGERKRILDRLNKAIEVCGVNPSLIAVAGSLKDEMRKIALE